MSDIRTDFSLFEHFSLNKLKILSYLRNPDLFSCCTENQNFLDFRNWRFGYTSLIIQAGFSELELNQWPQGSAWELAGVCRCLCQFEFLNYSDLTRNFKGCEKWRANIPLWSHVSRLSFVNIQFQFNVEFFFSIQENSNPCKSRTSSENGNEKAKKSGAERSLGRYRRNDNLLLMRKPSGSGPTSMVSLHSAPSCMPKLQK